MRHSLLTNKYGRRSVLGGGAAAAVGAISFAMVSCGDDDDDGSPAADETSSAAPTAASTTAPATQGPQKGGTVTLPGTADPPTLDPHLTSAAGTYEFVNFIYSRLLSYDASEGAGVFSNILRGDLATDWETQDGLSYVFTLRENLKWQDVDPVNGRSLTAEDVAFSLNRLRTDDPAYTNAFIFSVVTDIAAVDDKTVRFELREPFAPFLENVAHQNALILPPELIDKYGDGRQNAAGSGPFVLERSVQGSSYTLKRNANYYGDWGPHIDGIEYLIVPDPSLQVAGIRSGQLDWVATNKTQAEDLLSTNAELVSHRLPGYSGVRLAINNAREPFHDARVREAVDKAIDRQALIDTVLLGDGRLMSILGANMTPWDIPQDEIDAFWTRDVVGAKRLLEEAGYEDGFSTRWEVPVNQPALVPALELMQSFLREVNIDMTFDILEYAEWQKHANTQDFTAFPSGIRGFTDPDNILFRNYHPGSQQRWADLSSSEYADIVELIDRQRVELDVEARKQLVHDGIRAIMAAHLIPGLYDPASYRIVQPRVKGYAPSGLSGNLEWQYVWLEA